MTDYDRVAFTAAIAALDRAAPKLPELRYGYCPVCGDEGVGRERRPNGNDICGSGHTYPSRDARAAVEASQPKPEAVEGGEWRERYHDRCRVISDWHQRAVALGYDGVNELLTLALPCIVNNAGDERPDKDNPND